MSWTTSPAKAAWFALRYCDQLAESAVLVTRVARSEVYAYIADRDEEDFIVRAKRWEVYDDALVDERAELADELELERRSRAEPVESYLAGSAPGGTKEQA